MSTDVADKIEAVARDAGLSTAEVEQVQAEVEASTRALLLPAQITSIAGLPGAYLWTEFGTPRAATFTVTGPTGGAYSIVDIVTGVLVESGAFTFTPPPPIPILRLQPSGGPSRTFTFISVFTDPAGRFINMQLRKLAPVSFPPIFSAVRMI
jgi:hypothetical protein